MTKPLILEIKSLLSYILNSDNKQLRRKTLEFTMELLSEIEMDWRIAERALTAEINGDTKQSNELIENILDMVNKDEYEES